MAQSTRCRFWRWRAWCGIPVEMTLLTLLLYFPVCVLLKAQQLEFEVLKTCVPAEQNKTQLTARNSYARIGCSMQMVCRYRVSSITGEDHCTSKRNTSLTVRPDGKTSSAETVIKENLLVINTTKCSLTVEFPNMTTDWEGRYVCEDESANMSVERNIQVGEAPVEPQNISVVYLPRRSISVQFDPVKTGLDLSEPGTLWTVEYNWSDSKYTMCKGRTVYRKCKERVDGLCQPCELRLKKYNGCGQYTGFGFFSFNISFRITAKNIFGESSVTRYFSLLNWVKPGAVSQLAFEQATRSSLNVSVPAIAHVDQVHYIEMKNFSDYPLTLQWSVDLISERKQSLLHEKGRNFSETYGFVRNLEDDEAALNQTVAAAFPKYSRQLLWNSSSEQSCAPNPAVQYLPITDLPFPGYFYNVSVQSFARYPDEKVFLNASLAYTEEAAPLEGPELHDSFAFCVRGSLGFVEACVTCLIYFKEIPCSKRGGVLVNYSVTVTPLNTNSQPLTDKRCRQGSSPFVLEAKGQDNTLVIHNLDDGGDYHISLRAQTAAGMSPASSRTLHVHTRPPSTAPRNIVLEKLISGSMEFYDLYWATAESNKHDKLQYFVHYCNATVLQLQGSTAMDCVTNMVSKPMDDTSTFNFYQPVRDNGLRPAFFVSTVTPDGVSSGLQPVGCFYARNSRPDKKLWIRDVEGDVRALIVTFSLPCGPDMNYQYCQPEQYAVAVKKVKSSESCLSRCDWLMHNSDYDSQRKTFEDNLQELVRYEQRNLEPDTLYCVGINFACRGMPFLDNRWHCRSARTRASDKTWIPAVTSSFIVVFAVAACFLSYIAWKRYQQRRPKFGLQKESLLIEKSWICQVDKVRLPNGSVVLKMEAQLQGKDNPIQTSNGNNVANILTTRFSSSGNHSANCLEESAYGVAEEGNTSHLQGAAHLDRYPASVPVGAGMDENLSDENCKECTERSWSDEDASDDDLGNINHTDDSHSTKQPLINRCSGDPKLQQPGLTSQCKTPFPASQDETRPLQWGQQSRGRGSKLASLLYGGEDLEFDEEKTSFSGQQPGMSGPASSPSAADRISSDLTAPQPLVGPSHAPNCELHLPSLSEKLGRNNKFHPTPGSTVLTSTELCSVVEPPVLLKEDISDSGVSLNAGGNGMGQPFKQSPKDITQCSIDDILPPASMVTRAFSAAAETEGLVLEDILRAAENCPWKDAADVCAGFEGQAARNSAARPDSACLAGCESGIDTESAKETDADSESLTENSQSEQ